MGIKSETKNIIKGYIIDLIKQEKSPYEATKIFALSRQTINKYLKELDFAGIIEAQGGKTRKSYSLKKKCHNFEFEINSESSEDLIFVESVEKLVENLPENVRLKIEYSFTEMVNNVIDHSGSSILNIFIIEDFTEFRMYICDRGIGIFKKIMADKNLSNEKQAIFQLSKGKLTSDPANHSGEGIFFTSRICNEFGIVSFDKFFHSHNNGEKDMLRVCCENTSNLGNTVVALFFNKQDKSSISDVFLKYQNEFDGFSKTEIHVKLAEEFSKTLMSRSQAKRVMSGFENFKEVLLDFKGVSMVGQAFADQIFRVYKLANPGIEIKYTNVNDEIQVILDHVFKRIEELKNEK